MWVVLLQYAALEWRFQEMEAPKGWRKRWACALASPHRCGMPTITDRTGSLGRIKRNKSYKPDRLCVTCTGFLTPAVRAHYPASPLGMMPSLSLAPSSPSHSCHLLSLSPSRNHGRVGMFPMPERLRLIQGPRGPSHELRFPL